VLFGSIEGGAEPMKLIYIGDIVGRSGRTALMAHLPTLKERYSPDFIMVNGENAAHGFGITEKICKQFFEAGVDAITTGNHVWDQREIINYIDDERRLLRPLNYPKNTPGQGAAVYETKSGKKILVAQVLGRLFMETMDDPFVAIDQVMAEHQLGDDIHCAVVDIHAEATSEKMAMGHYLDGRVSMVVGTHSHIPTADYQIFQGGMAYQTDLGMCGDYNSVIGMKKEAAINRFTKKIPGDRLSPGEEESTLCAVYLETDAKTGKATRFDQIRIGGRLSECLP